MFKRFLFFVCFAFISIVANAETFSMQWFNEDGTVYETTTCNAGDDIILPTAPAKKGYTFMGWMAYTPIEYLESTGTQYIDTGITRTNISKIEITIQIASNLINSDQKLFGSNPGYGTGTYFSTYQGYYRGTDIPVSDSLTSIQITRFPSFAAIVSYNGNSFNTNSWWVESTTMTTFPIFAGYHSSNLVAKSQYKCFQLKLYDLNGELVRYMIPVLDGADVPCMYDKVTNTFFYNAGTGSFVAGPVVGN